MIQSLLVGLMSICLHVVPEGKGKHSYSSWGPAKNVFIVSMETMS